MKKLLLISIQFFSFNSYSQPMAPETEVVTPGNRVIFAEPAISQLNDEIIQVIRHGERFFFTPRPMVDWAKFSESIADLCREKNESDRVDAELVVGYWTDDIRKEIIQKASLMDGEDDLATSKLNIIPHSAHSPVVTVGKDKVIVGTIMPEAIFAGEKVVANSTQLNKIETYQWAETCKNLRLIDKRRELETLFHATAYTFTRDEATAQSFVTALNSVKAKIDNKEREVEFTTVSTEGGSSGFSIKVPGGGLGKTRGSSTTTTENEQFRVVNRNWLANTIREAQANVEVMSICQSKACNISEDVLKFITAQFTEQTVNIQQQADKSYALVVGDALKAPVQIEDLDKDVKAKLDSLLKQSSSDEAEYAGVKAKNTVDNTITFNGDTTWKRVGKDWIPTSFKAHVIDVNEFTSAIRMSISKTIIDTATKAAFPARQIVNENFPGSVEINAASRIKKLQERMNAVEQNLSQHDNCENVEGRVNRDKTESCFNHAEHIAAVQCSNGKFIRFIRVKSVTVNGQYVCVFNTTCCN